MCDILAAKKPLLVIVNNKSGQSEADPDYRHLYDTVANKSERSSQNNVSCLKKCQFFSSMQKLR
ncbi:hypothetical protein CXB77_11430 [Chromatium okenii]|uniref:Uncharacterized protein n=1 Tax=Chromatium okenii TaxID=61644 RepID=A0A2S7XRH7_9GAMM|nr:hypothetical protein CXB77_11430 [Chromatium okenii]